ncbi:MAG: site-2 protease family protein [Phycisphaerales bacterium]|nr:site-2 protease family protein [Phycisphaerales bacterium]
MDAASHAVVLAQGGSGWWIADLWQQGETVRLASWIFWVLAAIVLHELGHGIAAIWQGDDTPRALGRMTINPVVHMGWFSIVAFLLIGIAWGLMPVKPSNFRWGPRRGGAFVAAAGPAVNLALCAVCVIGCAAWRVASPGDPQVAENVTLFLFTGAWLNLWLMMFNLLPMPPLDGAAVISGISRSAARLMAHPRVQQIGFIAVLLLMISGGSSVATRLAMGVVRYAVIAIEGLCSGAAA